MDTKLPFVIADTREKEGHAWHFNKTKEVAGTIVRKLDYGDYSIEGYETKFVVERKGSPSELIGNMFSADKDRFLRELENLKSFKQKWIICEFTLGDVSDHLNLVANTRWKKRFANGGGRFTISMSKVLGYLSSLTIQYGVNFIFVEKRFAKEFAKRLLLKAIKYSG